MTPATRNTFIKIGAGWGVLLGVCAGLMIAIATLLSGPGAAVSALVMYPVIGAGAGALGGGLQGVLIAISTWEARKQGSSLLYNDAGMIANYRTTMVASSVLLASVLPFLLALRGIWRIELEKGLLISIFLGLAAGFIGYKIADWYMEQEYGMRRKSPPDQQNGEAQPSLNELLERHDRLHRPGDIHEDVSDQQHRTR